MNILVTGGAGFIGSNLIEKLLLNEHHVVSIDNYDDYYEKNIKIKNIETAKKSERFKEVIGDIRNEKELEQCFEQTQIDIVIHLAAKAGVRPSFVSPHTYIDVNVNGTLILLEMMKKYKVKKMVYASSSSVYGNNNKIPFTETDEVSMPISPYAVSKRAGELLCYNYHVSYGMDIFCLRFFTVFGPKQRPDLAIHKFTKLILNNEPITIYGDGNSKRDYTFIEDIVTGIICSIRKVEGYEIINLGGSKTTSLNELISIIEVTTNKKAKIIRLKEQLGDIQNTYANIDKANKLLGYYPKVQIHEGIKQFIEWYINNGNG